MTQEEFNAMLQIAIAQGLPGGNYISKYSRGEDIDAALDGGMRAAYAAAVPVKYVTLAASELQDYLDNLPKLLTEYFDISVTGELNSAVNVENFYGAGSIQIYGGAGFQMKNILSFFNCSVPISIHSIEFQENEKHTGANGLLKISSCNFASIFNCGFSGRGNESLGAALELRDGSVAYARKMRVSGMLYALEAFSSSAIGFYPSSGQNISIFENNINGAYVLSGGMVFLSSGMPDTLGGTANVKVGGIIVKGNGTLL